jgi:hypothetical protein
MCPDGTEGDLLILAVYFVQKTFVCKSAVIGMVVCDSVIGLGNDLCEGFYCENNFVDSKITHEVYVHKIANMITKCGTAPNALACKEAGHLWNEPRLCRDNLIDQNAISRKNVF